MSGEKERPVSRPLDLLGLLEALARHGVDFTVVGGVAVQVHGHRRTTKDLDLVPAPRDDNYERLAAALGELEARPVDAVAGELATKHGELHILNDLKGAPAYEELRGRALVLRLGEVDVPIVSLDHLIRIKRASGRASDLDDIAVLTAVEGGA